MKSIRDYIRRLLDGQMVRPLAVAGPILVLLVCLPLLRPLRHPMSAGPDEILRLATVQSIVEKHSLQLDSSYARIPGAAQGEDGAIYSTQPPMFSVALALPAWVIRACGIWFDSRHVLVAYLLTVAGVTLPVATAAGLVYRMGRLFELRRPWRTGLGITVVGASGLLSYATVLNPYAPAAVLVLASAACLIHVASVQRAERRAGWFALAGASAALAATIAPAAIILFTLFWFVIPTMRFSFHRQVLGMFLYILAAIPIFAIHVRVSPPIGRQVWLPAAIAPLVSKTSETGAPLKSEKHHVPVEVEDDPQSSSAWSTIVAHATWLANATVGEHGIFSHFPVLLVGAFGIGAVMHRHWPSSTKTLAAATGVSALIIMILYRVGRVDFSGAMFASKWFIVFTPMLLFWSGAWVRRSHSSVGWGLAIAALLISLTIGVIGATDPMPRRGFNRFTALSALSRLIQFTSTNGANSANLN